MPQVLPTAANQDTEYEDFYESTLSAPVTDSDTDFYPVNMPVSEVGFLVLDAAGAAPEIIFYNEVGANYVRCPSAVDGEGRGVFQTTPQPWESGTTIGMYSIAAFFEGIVTGRFLRDGFLEARHFSPGIAAGSWTGAGEQFTYASSVGQKEFTYVIADLVADKYSKGMKLQLPRVTSLGTQSADFELSSSQYGSKSSPTNISFTDDCTAEAWIWLESYGTVMDIISRRNGTQGWEFRLAADGRIEIVGYNASLGNYKSYLSNQAISLGKWVHVAATMDMSGNSGAIYINGVLIPTNASNGGTNPTSLVQAGDLQVGAVNGANGLFDGKMSEVRLHNTVKTASQIRDNYHKRYVGNETNLIAQYKFDGNLNDNTANANNLSASGSLVATNTSCPFLATEYAVITDVVEGGGNTTITVFTGPCVAPAESLTDVSYSSARTPYGFPADKGKWSVEVVHRTHFDQASPVSGTWYNLANVKLPVPTGCWDIRYQTILGGTASANGSTMFATISKANNTEEDQELTARAYSSVSATLLLAHLSRNKSIETTALTAHYLNAKVDNASTNPLSQYNGNGSTTLRAECQYI